MPRASSSLSGTARYPAGLIECPARPWESERTDVIELFARMAALAGG